MIAQITIDCHDEADALSAFENAFDQDAKFPLSGAVTGEHVEVLSFSVCNVAANWSLRASEPGIATTTPSSTSPSA